MRYLVPIAVILIASSFHHSVSAQQFSQTAETFSALEAELALNEGIMQYEMGDYQGARQTLQPLSSTYNAAAQYCDLCDSSINGEGSFGIVQDGYQTDCQIPGGMDYGVQQPVNRRWNFTVLTGYQYDSNVSLSPNFIGLGSISDKDDSSWYLASFGDYRLVEEADHNVGLVMSTYNNFYFNQTQFDLADYMGGMYANRVLAENIIGGIRYEYHKTILNDDSFSDEHRIVPNISFLNGDVGHTTLYYEFDAINFEDQPLIPALDPSANVHGVGITRARYLLGGQGRFFYGYRFENAVADGSDFDRKTDQVNARIEVPLRDRLIFDLGFRYFWDNYKNPNSLDFEGRSRDDDRTEIRSGLQMIFNRHLSTRFDYTFIDSDSNVANLFDVQFFDYSRNNFTAQLIYDF